MFPDLSFNAPDLRIQRDTDQTVVWDLWRKKWVVLTPEEWVRQHVAHHFVSQLGYPSGRIALEISLKVHAMTKRADMVVYSAQGKPILVVECKAPNVAITQSVMDQVARYNLALGVSILVVTNGQTTHCCRVNHHESSVEFISAIPTYAEMCVG
ncbi:MAG: type I restriction enzyme HsdR N-terminal domain-containing protein [Flavobacteriales bacterium]